jgi:DNA-binding CsgD family transcriptional regulator
MATIDSDRARTLLGRPSECEALEGLLESVRVGESRTLVLRGEAGVGKTALLEFLVDRASGFRVARAVGVESEMELAYATLHQLCAPMLDRLENLPGPQRNALGVVFGLRDGMAPDRFLVGLAVLGLLSEVAAEEPLLCVIDDAQWLDRASAEALAFVARRLLAEPVALVIGTRAAGDEFKGGEELVLGGLPDDIACELLDSAMPGPLDGLVRDRLVAEARGNPLALLELPRNLTPAQLAGGFGIDGAVTLTQRIEESYVRRLRALPADTQRLVLVAAAEPVGDPGLLWRAADSLGISPTASAAAVSDGLLGVGARVRFHHPLVRTAVYQSASPEDRQSAHAALAEATDAELDPDRRAWHRAQAALGPDDEVARELEQSAGRALARGGLAASAAFLAQAVRLTLDPARRGERALAAAQAALLAGDTRGATALLGTAQAASLNDLGLARVDLLHARTAFASNRSRDAPAMLLRAAKKLESLDVALAREAYLEAFSAGFFAGRLGGDAGLPDVALAARSAPAPSGRPAPTDLLLDGHALLFTEGYDAAAPVLHRALRAFRDEEVGGHDLRWLWLACITAADLWDDRSWQELSARHVALCREAGALSELPIALSSRAHTHLFAGEMSTAVSLVQELDAVNELTGGRVAPYAALGATAWRGRESEALALTDRVLKDSVARGEGNGLAIAYWVRAMVYNALGRYEEAVSAAEESTAYPSALSASHNWGLVELVEASARCGRADRAAAAFERLAASTRAGGTSWARGVEARSRALLTEGPSAETLYHEAMENLADTRCVAELARARLLYGEWLRRGRRRLDAREQLRAAHDVFAAMGAEAFAERASRELLATGERARKRTPETRDELTAQELQVARLAREGLSNPQIGARLLISPRTVEYHLHKVFNKLEIRSRTQLESALPARFEDLGSPPLHD